MLESDNFKGRYGISKRGKIKKTPCIFFSKSLDLNDEDKVKRMTWIQKFINLPKIEVRNSHGGEVDNQQPQSAPVIHVHEDEYVS